MSKVLDEINDLARELLSLTAPEARVTKNLLLSEVARLTLRIEALTESTQVTKTLYEINDLSRELMSLTAPEARMTKNMLMPEVERIALRIEALTESGQKPIFSDGSIESYSSIKDLRHDFAQDLVRRWPSEYTLKSAMDVVMETESNGDMLRGTMHQIVNSPDAEETLDLAYEDGELDPSSPDEEKFELLLDGWWHGALVFAGKVGQTYYLYFFP